MEVKNSIGNRENLYVRPMDTRTQTKAGECWRMCVCGAERDKGEKKNGTTVIA